MDGIIAVNKEAGMTSHDVVARLRRMLGTKKIGHGGTLDPQVTGVLPIALGKATRLIEYMQEGSKIYEGQITLGYSTTTEDAWGEVVESTPLVPGQITVEQVDKWMAEMLGDIQQTPPMYSAVKVKGRRLYEYAREGQVIDRPSRWVTIYDFSRQSDLIWEGDLVRFDFRVECSKGTYVRTLAVDLGAQLGLASHMSALQRIQAAGLDLEQSFTLEEIERAHEVGQETFLRPLEDGVRTLASYALTEEEKQDLSFGRSIASQGEEKRVAAFYQGKLVAILEKKESSWKPKKVFS